MNLGHCYSFKYLLIVAQMYLFYHVNLFKLNVDHSARFQMPRLPKVVAKNRQPFKFFSFSECPGHIILAHKG
jgi:hypothetical protein